MTVLDASALLCFLLDEPGAAEVEASLDGPIRCSAANWSKIAQKASARGLNWRASRQLLLGYGTQVEPVGRPDAEVAALLWAESPHVSITDRLCLTLARRVDEVVLTADRAWGTSAAVRQIRP